MEKINIDDFKKGQKKRERIEKLQEKRKDFENWYNQNKELAMVVIPIVGGCGVALVKGVSHLGKAAIRRSNLKREQNIRELYCYDNSLGHYWVLRRKLTNAEWIEIDNRKRNGERLSNILSDLRVLK